MQSVQDKQTNSVKETEIETVLNQTQTDRKLKAPEASDLCLRQIAMSCVLQQ